MYDRLYVAFLHKFNVERDYYECHDLMEDLWLEEGRNPLYQGLLQVAVGLYHHGNGNPRGAVKLLRQAVDKLQAFSPDTLGIDLGKLTAEARQYLGELEAAALPGAAELQPYDLTIVIRDAGLQQQVDAYAADSEAPDE